MNRSLWHNPQQYDFFQAVRLLEKAVVASHAEENPWHAVGEDAPPRREVIRFRAHASLTFSGSAIHRLERPHSAQTGARTPGPPELTVNILGLTGPAGVLPQHYTSLMLTRLRHKDHALREFLDLFNHRLISHFYRAWKKYRFPIGFEQTDGGRNGTDPFTQALYSLIGMGTGRLRGRNALDDQTPVYYAGLFAHRPRPAVNLERMLSEHLGQPVLVEQFRGGWLQLAGDIQSRLAERNEPEGQFNRLGQTVVVGERVWDVQGKFRLVIGPLNYRAFRQFMPDGPGLRPLCDLTRSYVGPELAFEFQVLLAAAEIPECQLRHSADAGPRLGWNTWLRSRPAARAAGDAVFSLDTI